MRGEQLGQLIVSVDAHGAKFQHVEELTVQANAFLAVEDRAVVRECNQDGEHRPGNQRLA